jgi:acyl dehydratase
MNIVFRLITTDDDGDDVLEQYWSRLLLGPAAGGDHGTPPPAHTFPEDARNRPVGSARLFTTRDQPFRYSGASGDHSSLHVNDEAARAVGFPRKILQGLCTLAVTTRGLSDLAAGGDPRRLRRIAVRFSSPVFPGDAVDVDVYDAGPAAPGAHAFAFEASANGKLALRHGLVEVAPE